jgi:hypothetical protein
MARTVTTKQAALAKARERRLALDAERDARDHRVEEATAEALLLLEQRAAAESAMDEASAGLSVVLRRLLTDGIGADGAASLVGLDVTEVRRLSRTTSTSGDGRAGPRVDAGVGRRPAVDAPRPARNQTAENG